MSKNYLNLALKLEYFTILWNILEGILAVSVGIFSGSVSLVAYGLESNIEVFASSVVVWDLKGIKRTDKALRAIGFAYLLASFYIFFDATKNLISKNHANPTLFGIILMFIAAIGMITLGLSKRSVGKKMQSSSVLADAKFTLIDACLSTSVLVGLLCNALFSFWWMDQAIALLLAGVAFREGLREIF